MEMLKLFRGEQLLAQRVLLDRPVEFGRAPGCDFVVDDPEVADRHWLAMRRLGTVVAYCVAEGKRARAQHLPLGLAVRLGRDHSVVRERDPAAYKARVPHDTENLVTADRRHRALVVVMGRGADARRLRLGDRPVHVGRGEDNDIVLGDRAASLRHCRLEPSAEGLMLRDLGSRNGTFVNGIRVERALLRSGARIGVGRSELSLLEKDAAGRLAGTGIVAESPAMLALLAEAQRAAELPWPVLITGESGSGKEAIATLLHEHGLRRARPFVALNAGSVAEELVESELFGHERGAFTSANGTHRGVFEQADGGTLFLDEIGELPLSLQARLLRVLETGEIRRVGSESCRRVDVRVVAATHRDLRAMVNDGRFRHDLYFRLARIVLEVPPLRERPDDIRAIARHVLEELDATVGRRELSDELLDRLCEYAWPGNVRELRNVLAAAAMRSSGPQIGRPELERAFAQLSGMGGPLRASADELRRAVQQHGGNYTAAARALGIARSTLRDRIKR